MVLARTDAVHIALVRNDWKIIAFSVIIQNLHNNYTMITAVLLCAVWDVFDTFHLCPCLVTTGNYVIFIIPGKEQYTVLVHI